VRSGIFYIFQYDSKEPRVGAQEVFMETIQIRTRVKKTQNKIFQKIARQKTRIEPFETEEEALEFVTNLSMRQLKNER